MLYDLECTIYMVRLTQLGLPGLSVKWRPLKVEVARSGDIGYLHGTYELSFDETQTGADRGSR